MKYDLPHTNGQVESAFIKSAKQGMRKLTKSIAITSASNNGALHIWWGNDNLWHAERYRYCATMDATTSKTKVRLSE